MMTLKEVKNALRDGTMTLDDVEDNYPEYLEYNLNAEDATIDQYKQCTYEEIRQKMWDGILDFEVLKEANPEYYDWLKSEPAFDPETNPIIIMIANA